MIKGAWTDAAEVKTKAAELERIKWRLWHGDAQGAIDSIECMADDVTNALEDDPVSAPLLKLGKTLGEFATYITNNFNYVVNYGGECPEHGGITRPLPRAHGRCPWV
jgi:hypothetical protein